MLLNLKTGNSRRLFARLIIFCVMLSILSTNSFAKTYQIKDVPQTDAAFQSIQDVLNQGWMGLTLNKFYPDKNITRGEFALVLAKFNGQLSAASKVTKSSFKDVEIKDTYAKYIEVEKPYITYYKQKDGSYFKPSNYLTREDALVAIVKALGYDTDTAIEEGSESEVSLDEIIEDGNKVSASLKSFVTTGVVNELIDLKEVNGASYLYPKNNITRRQLAGLLINAKSAKEMNKIDDTTDDRTTDDTNETTVPEPTTVPKATPAPTLKSNTSVAKKYTVETLAKSVDRCGHMVVDGNNDLYYLNFYNDTDNKLMKISNSTKTVVADGGNENDRKLDFANLVFDRARNRVLLLCNINSEYYYNGAEFEGSSAVYDIKDLTKPVAKFQKGYFSFNDEPVMDGSSIIDGDSKFDLDTSEVTPYGGASDSLYATFINDQYISFSGGAFSIYDLSADKQTSIPVSLNGIYVDAASCFNNKFYIYSSGNHSFYEVDISAANPKAALFIAPSNISVKDGFPFVDVSKFTFGNDGSLIFYDSTNKAIRRISISK